MNPTILFWGWDFSTINPKSGRVWILGKITKAKSPINLQIHHLDGILPGKKVDLPKGSCFFLMVEDLLSPENERLEL